MGQGSRAVLLALVLTTPHSARAIGPMTSEARVEGDRV